MAGRRMQIQERLRETFEGVIRNTVVSRLALIDCRVLVIGDLSHSQLDGSQFRSVQLQVEPGKTAWVRFYGEKMDELANISEGDIISMVTDDQIVRPGSNGSNNRWSDFVRMSTNSPDAPKNIPLNDYERAALAAARERAATGANIRANEINRGSLGGSPNVIPALVGQGGITSGAPAPSTYYRDGARRPMPEPTAPVPAAVHEPTVETNNDKHQAKNS
jgi:hypothetical protein